MSVNLRCLSNGLHECFCRILAWKVRSGEPGRGAMTFIELFHSLTVEWWDDGMVWYDTCFVSTAAVPNGV